MDWWVGLLILAIVVLPLARMISRATELFVLRVEGGRCRFVRGRIPQSLLHDLGDVLKSTRSSGQLKAVTRRGTAVWVANGDFSEGTLQRLRNVLGTYPLAKIKAGLPPKR